MSIRTVLATTLLALGAVACAKTSDLAKLQDEANATVTRFQPAIKQLDERTDDILAAGNGLPPTPAGTDAYAIATMKAARGRIAQLHGMTTAAPSEIATAEKAGPEALHKFIDDTAAHMESGLREASADLTSVENWIEHVKARSTTKAPTPVLLAPTDAYPTPPTP